MRCRPLIALLPMLAACLAAGCFGIRKPRVADGDTGAGDGACVRSASVLQGHVTNARDLGGTPLDDGDAVACGALYRGGPLVNLDDEGCAAVKRLGIRTVVDLRTEGERLSVPDAACLDARMVLAPLPIPFSVSPDDYLRDLNTTDSIVEAFRAFGDDSAYPVYFHCTYGRDRTGVVAAVILRALGATRADVMQDYMLSQASVGAFPASLDAVLDEIDRLGIDATLAGAGVPDAHLAVLRARAVARLP